MRRMLLHESVANKAVLLSLLLQFLLLVLATFRKRSGNSILSGLIFVIYFISSYLASTIFISITGIKYFTATEMPIGLWAAIMLLHLSGQERLTAYSLEDNEACYSWTVSALIQWFIHLGVLSLGKDVPLPTKMLSWFAALRICFRGCRLRMGCQDMLFFEGFFSKDNKRPNGLRLGEGGDDYQTVEEAHGLLKSTLDLLADSTKFSREVRQSFITITNPHYAIRLVEIELNFIYECFHTNGTFRKHLNNFWSLIYTFSRATEPIFCVLVPVLFTMDSSNVLQSSHISRRRPDYIVTNVLLWGTSFLECISYAMTICSDWTIAALRGFLGRSAGNVVFRLIPERRRWSSSAADYTNYDVDAPWWVRFARNLCRRWSESISKFDFICYCTVFPRRKWQAYMPQLDTLTGIRNSYIRIGYVSANCYSDQLGRFVFSQLQQKPRAIIARLKSINGWSTDESFKKSILQWHITTYLLNSAQTERSQYHTYTKTLSDYMAYLLFMKPHFVSKSLINPLKSNEAAFTRKYIENIAVKFPYLGIEGCLNKFCEQLEMITPENSREANKNDVLLLAKCKADELRGQHGDNRDTLWQEVTKQWVDMLLYAASKYDKLEHVRGLCQGGELITIVWLLAFHLGFLSDEEEPVQHHQYLSTS